MSLSWEIASNWWAMKWFILDQCRLTLTTLFPSLKNQKCASEVVNQIILIFLKCSLICLSAKTELNFWISSGDFLLYIFCNTFIYFHHQGQKRKTGTVENFSRSLYRPKELIALQNLAINDWGGLLVGYIDISRGWNKFELSDCPWYRNLFPHLHEAKVISITSEWWN